MITTIEELEALPVGSVIKNRHGWILERNLQGWWCFGFDYYATEEVAQDMLPATLLIPNTISQETALIALHRLADNYKKNGLVNSLEDVLETLGIEVSDE